MTFVLAMKKVECQEQLTDSTKSRKDCLITKGGKVGFKRNTLTDTHPSKTLKQGGSYLSDLKDNTIVILKEDEKGEKYTNSPIWANLPHQSSQQTDSTFNAIKYTNNQIPFHGYFPGQFQKIMWMEPQKLFDMVDNHMHMSMLVERVRRENRAKTAGELKARFSTAKNP